MSLKITKEEILNFQKEWGNALVHIGKLYLEKKELKEAGEQLVDKFYAFNEGIVLFKPTRAAQKQFRNTPEGALSYFIGNNSNFPEDTGFALQPWLKVRFENHAFILNNHSAISMGNYFFTDPKGFHKKVEFTIGYIRTKTGQIKINLHHSSLPFRQSSAR